MALIRLNKEGAIYEFDPANNDNLLGRGGMGVVFKGRKIDRATGVVDLVAIKVLFADLPAESITRARREASIQIEHENVIRMFGCVDVVDAEKKVTCHVISEYLDGDTLDKRVAGGAILPEAETIKITKCILSGLYMLHNKGYIHRDIDPSNVMVCKNGQIKLIDFGIAKILTEYHDEFKQGTQEGKFIGKVNYASPEQAQGLHWITNTTSDIYSTGILLFELLTGRRPYSGTTYEIIQSHIDRPIVFSKTMNISLQRIISKATAKQQEDRYQSVSEFIVDLEKYEKGIRIPDPKLDRKSKQNGAKSTVYKFIAVLLVVIFGAIIGWVYNMHMGVSNSAQELVAYGQYNQAIDKYLEETILPIVLLDKKEISRLEQMVLLVDRYSNIKSGDTLLMREFERLGAKGMSDAYYYSAELSMKGISTPKDMDAALASLIKGAQDDNILCNFRLGVAYLKGECVSKNEITADKYFDKARVGIERLDDINNLSSELLYIYGKMYLYGYSVEKSVEQAKVLLGRSADDGNSAAYYELYLLYRLDNDNSTAASYLNEAVKLGCTEAEYELANSSNETMRFELLTKAANKRYSPAYYQLALSYKSKYVAAAKTNERENLDIYGKYVVLAERYDKSNPLYKSELAKYNNLKDIANKPKSDSTVKLKVEAEAKAKAEAAKLKAEQDAKLKAEADAKAKAEAAKLKVEQDAKLKAEQDAKLKAEQDAKLKAEQDAKLKAEQDAKLKAEQDAKLKAEQDAKLKAEQDAKLKAEQDAKLKAEQDAKLKAEQDAKLKAEQDAKLKAEQDAKLKAEQDAKLKAEQDAKAEAEKVVGLTGNEVIEPNSNQVSELNDVSNNNEGQAGTSSDISVPASTSTSTIELLWEGQ